MGDANRRGTKEERKLQGIAKRAELERIEHENRLKFESLMTESQRVRRDNARATLAGISSLATARMGPSSLRTATMSSVLSSSVRKKDE